MNPSLNNHEGADSSADIEQWLKNYVAEQYDLDPAKFDSHTPLVSLGDELNVFEIIMEIEEKYWITIPNDRYIDKNVKGSVGLYKDLSIEKLVKIIQELKKDNSVK
jgi:acyl carrier protein